MAINFFLVLLRCIFIFLLLSNDIRANEEDHLENSYIDTIVLTFREFAEQGGDPIWPRFHLTDRPSAFHFKNGHVYALNLTPKSFLLWEKKEIQHYPVLFCPQYPVNLMPLHPTFPLEEQKVFVFSLDHDSDSSFFPLLTFVHERFHLHQFQFFNKEQVMEVVPTDYQNIDLLTGMELELRLLVRFLQVQESESKIQYLKDYLAVSQSRRQFLHSSSIKWEDHLQKMEGLADYVSIKTFQVFPFIPNFKAEEMLLEMRNRKNKGDLSSAQDRIKGRHYFIGAVLGWALDFCEVRNWKLRIEREDISLQALLEEALFLDEEEKQDRLFNVQKALNWKEIRNQIDQQLKEERRESEQVIQAFHLQEGVVIRIGTPEGPMSSGGRHQKSTQIGQIKALIGDTSIATSQDQSWSLRFMDIPLVFEKQKGDRIFKLPLHVTLQLDGKELSLEKIISMGLEEIPFSSLLLKHEHCELNSKRSGKLRIQQDELFFKFN
jgi:hypothetical protein